VFIWKRYPAFLRGRFTPRSFAEQDELDVRQRLIEAADVVTVERGPGEAAPRLTAVIETKAARLAGAK
jgi:hypothetical protein